MRGRFVAFQLAFAGAFALAGCAPHGQASDALDLGVDLATAIAPGPGPVDGGPLIDDDGDGLDDRDELAWAQAYLPYISTSPTDGCTIGGLAVRVSPHPADAKMVHIIYDYLYNDDCGLGGHHGDDEVFAITADLTQAPPLGIIAIKAISHQNTPCERDSICGRCGGLTPCQTLVKGGVPWPAVWPSRAKHGSYVNRGASCTLLGTCLDNCDDAPTPTEPPIVNVGEPGHPLVHDLTDQGFITSGNGWTHMELFHFDPWKTGASFGGAGVVAADFVDPAFDTPACRP